MKDIFDQLQEEIFSGSQQLNTWSIEVRKLLIAARIERDFYKGAIIELEGHIKGIYPAGWDDWSHLYSFVLWYQRLGGNIDKADEVCFGENDYEITSYFSLAFYNLTDKIKEIILNAIDKEDYEVGVLFRQEVEDNWQIDDNYCAASFNNEYFDPARCSDYTLAETVKYMIEEFKLSSTWIDSQLTEEE